MNVGAVIGVLVLLVVLGFMIASFFVRRHRESSAPEAGWTRTNELFNDPSTNRRMRVWLDAKGERHYVEEGNEPAV